MSRISLIAAMDHNRLIGRDNQLPWHLPADLRHFKDVTMAKPILMGRKTYESIGRPLPGRKNIVISRDKAYSQAGCEVVHSIDAALACAADVEEIMVIGGASIYDLTLSRADRLYLTIIDKTFEGDAWFPVYDTHDWYTVDVQEGQHVDKGHVLPYRFLTLDRKT